MLRRVVGYTITDVSKDRASRSLRIPLLLDCFPLKRTLRSFEMTAITFPQTCYNIPEELHLHQHRYEKVKPRTALYISVKRMNPSLCSDATSRNYMGLFVGFSRLHYMPYGEDKNTHIEIFRAEDAKFRRDYSYPHPRISRSPIKFAKLS